MAVHDPLAQQIPEPELRRLYRDGSLSQRYAAARLRLDSPDSEANRVITAVSVLEGFSRAVAVRIRVAAGASVEDAYRTLRHVRPVELLRDEIGSTLGGGGAALGTEADWRRLEKAVSFRHLLVHEGTLLHHGSALALARCAEKFLERLAVHAKVREAVVRPLKTQASRFIGVDLAWQSANPSAVVVADGAEQLQVHAISPPLVSIDAILEYIEPFLEDDTVIAVDAPLIIKNEVGQRPCEREVSRQFGRYHAGAHASNLTLYPDAESLRFARALEHRGFTMQVLPQQAHLRPGRWFFEVYPHPAHVVLFGLEQIIKYKKGRVGQRRDGLSTFAGALRRELARAEPRLVESNESTTLLSTIPEILKGQSLKDHEDRLDALLCCYLAAHYWYWGAAGNRMIGDLDRGNIVVPTRRADR